MLLLSLFFIALQHLGDKPSIIGIVLIVIVVIVVIVIVVTVSVIAVIIVHIVIVVMVVVFYSTLLKTQDATRGVTIVRT